ncbi:MAG: ABC transporter permease, partial [Rhodobacteraceae bacterium]|nr:ABC transporter permease [Paracoccaceae bacterium]
MLYLEPRLEPSPVFRAITPFFAVILTVIAGGTLFTLMGKNPLEAIRVIFLDPIFNDTVASYTRPQILVKAAPLVMIALGLSYGFRANIWNIGAEGQYIIGALAGASVGLALYPSEAF